MSFRDMHKWLETIDCFGLRAAQTGLGKTLEASHPVMVHLDGTSKLAEHDQSAAPAACAATPPPRMFSDAEDE